MSIMQGPSVTDIDKIKSVTLSFNLGQAAGTYDLGTVSGGDILILSATPYVSVAGVGFTTAAIQTNDTTSTVILVATAAAVLTVGLSLSSLTAPTYLSSGKKIQGTIVGTGSSGTIKLAIRYQALTQGAALS